VKRAALAWLLVLTVSAVAGAERFCRSVSSPPPTAWRGTRCATCSGIRAAFLWIATSSGLSRFDGQAFPQLRHPRGAAQPTDHGPRGDTGRHALGRDLRGAGAAAPPGRRRRSGVRRRSGRLARPADDPLSRVDRAGRLWAGVGSGLAVHDHGTWRGSTCRRACATWDRCPRTPPERSGSRPRRGWWSSPARRSPADRGGAVKSAGADLLLHDRQGVLWIGRGDGLLAVQPAGRSGRSTRGRSGSVRAWGTRPSARPER